MPRWLASAGMVLTWAVWMFGSAVHYTFLPRCLSRSLGSVVQFAILQAALTGVVSWIMRRDRTRHQPSKLKQQQGLLLGNFEPSSQIVAARTDGPGGGGGGPPSCSSTSSQPSPPASSAAALGHDGKTNILIAGAAFAVAITMTNASVAYGSVAGSRMVKSLEPAIVAGLQLLAGMDSRADFPWVCLLAFAVSMMLAVAPTGITLLSASAALLSTAGISTRNVFVKKHMLALKASATAASAASVAPTTATTATATTAAATVVTKTATGTTTAVLSPPPPPQPGPSSYSSVDVQTHLNFVACTILIAFASAHAGVFVGGSGRDMIVGSPAMVPAPALAGTSTDLVIACASFAGFQVAALMVLERVTPTRQAAIKSLQNAITTGWALLIDTTGHGRHNSLEVVPALAWGICVVALASGAQLTLKGSPLLGRRLLLPARWTEGAGSLAARKKGGKGPSGGAGDHAGGVEIVVATSASGGAAGVVTAAILGAGGGAGGGGGGGGGGERGGGASSRGAGGDNGDSGLTSGAVVDANACDDPIVIKGPWGSTCSSGGPAKGPAIARPRDAGRAWGAGGATSSASVARIAWLTVYCACLAALLLQAALMGVARLSFDGQRARFAEYGDQGQAHLVAAGGMPRAQAAAEANGSVAAVDAAASNTGTRVHFPTRV